MLKTSINMAKLNTSMYHNKIIKNKARCIISDIDELIKKLNNEGKKTATYKLPTILNIHRMTEANAQTRVFYLVVVAYRNAAFDVKLLIREINKNPSYLLKLTWSSPKELQDLDTQKRALAAVTHRVGPTLKPKST